MSRTPCLFAILAASGCAAKNWYFDRDAGTDEAGVTALDDAYVSDDRALPGPDATLEGGSTPDVGPGHEKDPGPDAAEKCSFNGDCPFDAPLCSQPAGLCIRCRADDDCALDSDASDAQTTSVCNVSTGACVECTSNSTCADGTLPYCDPATDRCVRCLKSSDCGRADSVCDTATHTCTRMF